MFTTAIEYIECGSMFLSQNGTGKVRPLKKKECASSAWNPERYSSSNAQHHILLVTNQDRRVREKCSSFESELKETFFFHTTPVTVLANHSDALKPDTFVSTDAHVWPTSYEHPLKEMQKVTITYITVPCGCQ